MSGQPAESPYPELQMESNLPTEANEKSNFKPIVLGCFFGFVSFLVLFIGLWVFIFTGIYNNLLMENFYLYGVMFILSAIIAFSIGSYQFLRWAVPRTNIRNFGRLPNITIARKNAKGGLKNLTAIRIIVSVITCIFVYLAVLLVSYLISALIPQNPLSVFTAVITIVIPLFGLIVGPIIAILIYSRTTTS
jgi:hypothetical protein